MPTDSPPEGWFDGWPRRLNVRPDGGAWAAITIPSCPSVLDRSPSPVPWRDLYLDPDLGGPIDGQGRPVRIQIGHRDDDEMWTVPVSAATAALTWHLHRPLVAGLAVQGRGAYPWIADYQARTVTRFRDVPAGVGFTGYGGRGLAPLAWCGPSDLALLTPVAAEQSTLPEPPAQPTSEPVIFEAVGPGFVAFDPPVRLLRELVGTRVSVLDVENGQLATLPAPLVVGALSASPTGRYLLIDDVDDRDAADGRSPGASSGLIWQPIVLDRTSGRLIPVPAGTRWVFGDDDVLAWSDGSQDDVRFRPMTGGDDVRLRRGPSGSGIWCPLWHRDRPAVVDAVAGSVRLTTADRTQIAELPTVHGSESLLSEDIRLQRGGPVADPDRSGRFSLALSSATGRAGVAMVDLEHPDQKLSSVWSATPVEGGPGTRGWSALNGPLAELVVADGGALRRHQQVGDDLAVASTVLLGESHPATTGQHADRQERAISTGYGVARFQAPAITGVVTGDPIFLWIRAAEAGAGSSETASAPETVTLAGNRVAILDLPLHWPPDVTVEQLHEQIVGTIRTVLDLLTPDRAIPVVVGGHSFAATLALYALAHIPELAAAVAHSGCYNRTLTWGGFQQERRLYWQAPQLYQAFSALHFADRLDRPVLLLHGAEDLNPATPPEQAVELYRAIVAVGGRSRLVLFPHEGHNFHYRQTLLTVVREHQAWLERCGTVAASARGIGREHR